MQTPVRSSTKSSAIRDVFDLSLTPGRWRGYACWALFAIIATGFARWFGLLGLALVCVAATRRVPGWREPATLRLHAHQLHQVWGLQGVMCVVTREQRLWVYRDELDPATWSALRVWLRLNLPRQPVGLSISR